MKDDSSQPIWIAADKPGALRAYAEWLHREAVRMFLQDKTHCQILFLFCDVEPESVIPIS